MTTEQKMRLTKLIDQAVMLDFEEISIWKQIRTRNSEFAKNNVLQANESIKMLAHIKTKLTE